MSPSSTVNRCNTARIVYTVISGLLDSFQGAQGEYNVIRVSSRKRGQVSKVLNVRISEEKRARIAKFAARADHDVSAAVRMFVDKCLEFCEAFTWEGFKRSRIVPGDDAANGPAARSAGPLTNERKSAKG